MGRPQRALDPASGPVAAFAAELRELREKAGSPTFATMARRAVHRAGAGGGVSRTALTEAVGGDHLPSWRTVEAFVLACDASPAYWVARWERAKDDRAREVARAALGDDRRDGDVLDDEQAAVSEGVLEAAPAVGSPGAGAAASPARAEAAATDRVAAGLGGGHRQRQGWVFGGLTVVTVVAVVVVGVVWLALGAAGDGAQLRGAGDPPTSSISAAVAAGGIVVEIQNKYATGSAQLLEDTTPAYLTTIPVSRCYARDCIVEGTKTLWSGGVVTARCQVRGDRITNADETSAGIRKNPGRASSVRWYLVTMASGREGFIPEVWLTEASRGGLGLPECAVRAST